MKQILFIAAIALMFASCANGGDKKMTAEEENQFATEEVTVIDSSVTVVEDSIDAKEARVNDLLKGI